MCCGADKDEIVRNWSSPKTVKSVFGMGDAEAQAVIALVTRIPREARDILAKSVMRHGMVRGPISHAGLGSDAIRVGWGPDCLMREWTVDMQNQESTVILVAERISQDFDSRPVALRKPAGPAEVLNLQKVCRCFELSLAKFRAKVSEENFVKHRETLRGSFLNGGLDAGLMSKVEDSSVNWDVADLPDFGPILQQAADAIHKLQLERSAQLRIQVQAATFAECRHKLLEDQCVAEKYLTDRRACLNDWQNTVLLHKRRRYAAGQKSVATFASSKLDFKACGELLHGVSAEIAAFRQDFEASTPEQTGSTLDPKIFDKHMLH